MNRWRKWALNIIGALVIGAFGSGLWEVGAKPGLEWTTRSVLNTVTLGSAAAKDRIYKNAAKGPHEAIASDLLSLATLLVILAPLLTGIWIVIRFSLYPKQDPKLEDPKQKYPKLEPLRLEDPPATASVEEKKIFLLQQKALLEQQKALLEQQKASLTQEIAKIGNETLKLRKWVIRMAYTAQLIFTLEMAFLVISNLTVLQANSAWAFFSQSFAICRPYMEEKQAQMFLSRFASIRGRADYIGLVQELHRIAISNHRTLPDYKPW